MARRARGTVSTYGLNACSECLRRIEVGPHIKLITSGYVVVEQGGRLPRFDAGRISALDPTEVFVESVPDQLSIIAMRIPKRLLQHGDGSRRWAV